MNRVFNLLIATACVLTISRSAGAYIDAGSGSYLLQILFAGILGGFFVAKTAFRNLILVITRRIHPQENSDSVTHVR